MYPRFSLKWLLIAFTILGVAFYIAFVRPTVIAKRIAAEIERGDLFVETLHPFRLGDSKSQTTWARLKRWSASGNPVKVSLEPRTWDDLFNFRRRLTLVYEFKEPSLPVTSLLSSWLDKPAVQISVGLRGTQLIDTYIVRGDAYKVTKDW
jgi:hypothetical protein